MAQSSPTPSPFWRINTEITDPLGRLYGPCEPCQQRPPQVLVQIHQTHQRGELGFPDSPESPSRIYATQYFHGQHRWEVFTEYGTREYTQVLELQGLLEVWPQGMRPSEGAGDPPGLPLSQAANLQEARLFGSIIPEHPAPARLERYQAYGNGPLELIESTLLSPDAALEAFCHLEWADAWLTTHQVCWPTAGASQNSKFRIHTQALPAPVYVETPRGRRQVRASGSLYADLAHPLTLADYQEALPWQRGALEGLSGCTALKWPVQGEGGPLMSAEDFCLHTLPPKEQESRGGHCWEGAQLDAQPASSLEQPALRGNECLYPEAFPRAPSEEDRLPLSPFLSHLRTIQESSGCEGFDPEYLAQTCHWVLQCSALQPGQNYALHVPLKAARIGDLLEPPHLLSGLLVYRFRAREPTLRLKSWLPARPGVFLQFQTPSLHAEPPFFFSSSSPPGAKA